MNRTLVTLAGLAGLAGALTACDEKPKPTVPDAAPSASASPRTSDPPEEGCVRTALDGADSDPACVLAKMPDDPMRDLSKRISITVKPDADEVVTGTETMLRVVMQNVTKSDVLLVFDAHATSPAPHPDTSRLSGVKEEKAADPTPRIRIEVVTTYADNRPVDGLPMVPSQGTSPKLVGVRVRPGGKLTAAVRWWALRIPAPPPIFADDAGHRYFPKTGAVHLPPGEYGAQIDVPFHGLAAFERTYTTKLRVVAN